MPRTRGSSPRKAKELLFTSDWLSAVEAKRLGMVNQIVPRDTLETAALAMAQKIATKSLFALKLTKEAVNVAEDAQGPAGDADLVRAPPARPHALAQAVRHAARSPGTAAGGGQSARRAAEEAELALDGTA
jgi:enoyl-CoA hydratase